MTRHISDINRSKLETSSPPSFCCREAGLHTYYYQRPAEMIGAGGKGVHDEVSEQRKRRRFLAI